MAALLSGTRLGPYQITAKIGEGGMGEVYQATDTSLRRSVAIKVLPAHVADNADRLARFQREAEVLAALNHSNIAQIYGLERAVPAASGSAVLALVMELVDGPTLADQIAHGALPVGEALAIARQIAEALEVAHGQGIIHRDLKPANIKVRADGTVKVLDFGLAKAVDERRDTPGAFESPTITSPAMLTSAGVILGTAAYMSPEQARGKPVDKRADIWAFGCVLFEMLTGRRPFGGNEVPDVLANVIARDPDWSALPPSVPARVRGLLARCLTKDPRDRLHDIGDARLDVQDALTTPVEPTVQTTAPRRVSWLMAVPVAGITLLLGLGAGAAVWRRPPVVAGVTRVMVDAAPADEITTTSILNLLPAGGRPALAWSPTGETLAFIGSRLDKRQVYLRDLASGEAKPIEGTEGASAFAYSPDGEWIVFWVGGELRKVRVSGGPSARICATAQLTGLTWGKTRIVFTTRYQIFEVPPAGGDPRALTNTDMRRSTPFLMPGENALLYTEYGKNFSSGDERVMLRRLNGASQPAMLLSQAADARYIPTGHLAFMRQGTLFVVPFDAQTLEVRGNPVAVVSEVAQSTAAWFSEDLTLSGQFTVSPRGTLAYVPGHGVSLPLSDLVRVDRRGNVEVLGAPPSTYRERVAVSPDGSTLAVSVQSAADVRLFFYNIARGTLATAFPQQTDRDTIRPVWSADGKIAMQVYSEGGSHLAILAADRVSVVNEALLPRNGFAPSGWFRSGEALVGHRDGDLWRYDPSATGDKWTRLSDTPAYEQFPAWSPDGRWLAYSSNVSGREEVYVQPYPGPGSPQLVSIAGGRAPVWSPEGRELFYTEPRPIRGEFVGSRVMAVPMTNPARPGKPESLFETTHDMVPLDQCASTPCYSVAAEGRAFYTMRFRPWQPPRVTSARLVLNWFEEVRRLAPTN